VRGVVSLKKAGFSLDEICSIQGALRGSRTALEGTRDLAAVLADREEQVVVPHAAAGLCAWLTAIEQHRDGSLAYAVPDQHSDGIDAVTIEAEVSECPPIAV
jgi:hypothetical protein